jgi:hypothetical protein
MDDPASRRIMMISSLADGNQALPSSLPAGEGNPHTACATCERNFGKIPRAFFASG